VPSDARAVAARLLIAIERPGDFLENRLEQDRDFLRLPPADRRLAQELVYGVTRWRATLDWLIDGKTAHRPAKIELVLLLRLGLYQLFWLDRVPGFAAVHETVRVAREFGFNSQSGMINAILRAYGRELEATREKLKALRTTHPATGWSHPGWLVERWNTQFGRDAAQRLLEWDNSAPKTFARVNRLKTDGPCLNERWKAEGVESHPVAVDWVPEGEMFEISSPTPVSELPSFIDGGFYLQDPSTLLAVGQLDPQPTESILDLCAAPGGKTVYMAQRMENRGRIVAHDSSAGRLRLLDENCKRLGVRCVEATSDLKSLPAGEQFDRVLVDAPCSNTGVLRRRVELRWRLTPKGIADLASAQDVLLDQAAVRVRLSGKLMYSTCSLEPEENGAVVQRFLVRHPEFQKVQERSLSPAIDSVDGAYVALLVRRE
jgi:16S rRNA (cytosine967-C5)-methyltransferase